MGVRGCAAPQGERRPSGGAPPLTGCQMMIVAVWHRPGMASGVRHPLRGAPPLEGCATPWGVRFQSFAVFRCFCNDVKFKISIPVFFGSSAPPTKKATTIDEIDVFSQTWSRRTVRIANSRAVCQVLCKVKQPPHVGGRARKKSSPKQSSQENRFSLNVIFFAKTKKYFFRFCLFLLIFRSFLFDENRFSCDQK